MILLYVISYVTEFLFFNCACYFSKDMWRALLQNLIFKLGICMINPFSFCNGTYHVLEKSSSYASLWWKSIVNNLWKKMMPCWNNCQVYTISYIHHNLFESSWLSSQDGYLWAPTCMVGNNPSSSIPQLSHEYCKQI